jgi:cytochrome c peroxidase
MALKKNQYRIGIAVCSIFACFLFFHIFPWSVFKPSVVAGKAVLGKSNAINLKRTYERWMVEYSSSSPPGPMISLVWNKGLSSEFTKAKGIAEINLENGTLRVRIKGLDDHNISEVWLVDNVAGPGRSIIPEQGDKLIHAGSLQFEGTNSWLYRKIDPVKLHDFEVNWIVVTRSDGVPYREGVLYGSTSLFQRIFHYPDRTPLPWEQGLAQQTGLDALRPTSAYARGIVPSRSSKANLINQGRDLFFNETFGGNGRTCGTCHPEENNFTIDPKFIATLPDKDPLFVAEFIPALSEDFEKPELMRKAGLILENTNGFDDLKTNFTMRSVPHLLAMRTSIDPPIVPPQVFDRTDIPPNDRTGWSGDGSPTDPTAVPPLEGTLRDFAVGAVIQHFPLTTAREVGSDFRLPTEAELDAMEAFQLSLGRQEEFDDFNTIRLTHPIAERGRLNYIGEGLPDNSLNCNACHFNGGANTNPDFDFGPFDVTPTSNEGTVDEANRSFGPRIEELIDQPGDIIDPDNNPFDDGFGNNTNLFNVPVVIEAADTGPFFHANQIETVEAMVAFYSSQRHLRNGEVLPAIVPLNGSQVANIGAFLRVLNADENARSAIALLDKAMGFRKKGDQRVNLQLAAAEIEDALEVLEGGRLHFDDAIPMFKKAGSYIKQVMSNRRRHSRYSRIKKARNELEAVRKVMIIRETDSANS